MQEKEIKIKWKRDIFVEAACYCLGIFLFTDLLNGNFLTNTRFKDWVWLHYLSAAIFAVLFLTVVYLYRILRVEYIFIKDGNLVCLGTSQKIIMTQIPIRDLERIKLEGGWLDDIGMMRRWHCVFSFKSKHEFYDFHDKKGERKLDGYISLYTTKFRKKDIYKIIRACLEQNPDIELDEKIYNKMWKY